MVDRRGHAFLDPAASEPVHRQQVEAALQRLAKLIAANSSADTVLGNRVTEVEDEVEALGGGGAPTNASYVTIASNATLTAERTLTQGTGITITDGGANSTVTIATTITQYTDEMARDAIGAALVEGTGITITVSDGSDTITVSVDTSEIAYSDLYALDFTALADNALSGTESLDSRNWIVTNQGNSTLFEIDNGTGLHWDASTTSTTFNGSFTTSTRMQITWGQLLGSLFDPMGEYVIDLRMGSYSLGVANNAFWLGMIGNGTANAQMAGIRIHNSGGTVGVSFQGTTNTTQIAVTPDVLSIRVSLFRVDGYYGTWSSGWPAASAMTYVGSGAPAPPGTAGNAGYFQNGGTSGNESSLVLSAMTGETGGAMDVVVRQLRVRRVR